MKHVNPSEATNSGTRSLSSCRHRDTGTKILDQIQFYHVISSHSTSLCKSCLWPDALPGTAASGRTRTVWVLDHESCTTSLKDKHSMIDWLNNDQSHPLNIQLKTPIQDQNDFRDTKQSGHKHIQSTVTRWWCQQCERNLRKQSVSTKIMWETDTSLWTYSLRLKTVITSAGVHLNKDQELFPVCVWGRDPDLFWSQTFEHTQTNRKSCQPIVMATWWINEQSPYSLSLSLSCSLTHTHTLCRVSRLGTIHSPWKDWHDHRVLFIWCMLTLLAYLWQWRVLLIKVYQI